MKYWFIDSERSNFEVEEMCHALDVTRSGYYAWKRTVPRQRARDNAQLLIEINEIHTRCNKIYGSPRITECLHDKHIRCSKNRVARLMNAHGIRAKTAKKWKVTTNSRHTRPVSDNLVNQEFIVTVPDAVYVSDITYIWTDEGWLYLSIVMDLYSRKIIGWAMDERIKDQIVLDALNMAWARRRPGAGVVMHSDRGSQYASDDVQAWLALRAMIGSMSGAGNCYDNACAESFFHTLKTELVYFERYRTREEARTSIFNYIEIFYNRFRKHSTLGYKSPEQFEQMDDQKKIPA